MTHVLLYRPEEEEEEEEEPPVSSTPPYEPEPEEEEKALPEQEKALPEPASKTPAEVSTEPEPMEVDPEPELTGIEEKETKTESFSKPYEPMYTSEQEEKNLIAESQAFALEFAKSIFSPPDTSLKGFLGEEKKVETLILKGDELISAVVSKTKKKKKDEDKYYTSDQKKAFKAFDTLWKKWHGWDYYTDYNLRRRVDTNDVIRMIELWKSIPPEKRLISKAALDEFLIKVMNVNRLFWLHSAKKDSSDDNYTIEQAYRAGDVITKQEADQFISAFNMQVPDADKQYKRWNSRYFKIGAVGAGLALVGASANVLRNQWRNSSYGAAWNDSRQQTGMLAQPTDISNVGFTPDAALSSFLGPGEARSHLSSLVRNRMVDYPEQETSYVFNILQQLRDQKYNNPANWKAGLIAAKNRETEWKQWESEVKTGIKNLGMLGNLIEAPGVVDVAETAAAVFSYAKKVEPLIRSWLHESGGITSSAAMYYFEHGGGEQLYDKIIQHGYGQGLGWGTTQKWFGGSMDSTNRNPVSTDLWEFVSKLPPNIQESMMTRRFQEGTDERRRAAYTLFQHFYEKLDPNNPVAVIRQFGYVFMMDDYTTGRLENIFQTQGIPSTQWIVDRIFRRLQKTIAPNWGADEVADFGVDLFAEESRLAQMYASARFHYSGYPELLEEFEKGLSTIAAATTEKDRVDRTMNFMYTQMRVLIGLSAAQFYGESQRISSNQAYVGPATTEDFTTWVGPYHPSETLSLQKFAEQHSIGQ